MDDAIFSATFPDSIEAILNEDVDGNLTAMETINTDDSGSVTSTSAVSLVTDPSLDQNMAEEEKDDLSPFLGPFRGRCSTWPRRQLIHEAAEVGLDLQPSYGSEGAAASLLPQVRLFVFTGAFTELYTAMQ